MKKLILLVTLLLPSFSLAFYAGSNDSEFTYYNNSYNGYNYQPYGNNPNYTRSIQYFKTVQYYVPIYDNVPYQTYKCLDNPMYTNYVNYYYPSYCYYTVEYRTEIVDYELVEYQVPVYHNIYN